MENYLINPIIIQEPGNISFCFNPDLLIIKEVTKKKFKALITLTCSKSSINEIKDDKESINGIVEFDISTYTKRFFDRNELLIPVLQAHSSKLVTIKLDYLDENGKLKKITEIKDCCCIWGNIEIGEIFNPCKKISWFKNLPFTFSFLHCDDKKLGNLKWNNFQNSISYFFPKGTTIGILNLNPEELFSRTNFPENQYPEELKTAIFTIDYSNSENSTPITEGDFNFHPTATSGLNIKLHVNNDTEGTYLRWVDRHGFTNYYLFKNGTLQMKTSDEGIMLQQAYTGFSGQQHYEIGRIQGKTAQKSRKLCVPLADEATYRFLESILTAPIVDMFCGYDDKDNHQPVFVPVNVTTGSTPLTGESYKDFEIEISLPEKIAQIY